MDASMTFDELPVAIQAEVLRMQREEFDWPNVVPAYLEYRVDGSEKWTRYENTTVADCEQIGEYHARQAVAAVRRYLCRASPASIRRAARHILIARIMRCRSFSLREVTEYHEADMPFSCE